MMSHGCRIRMSRLLSCFGIKYNSLCFIPRDKRPTNIISQAIKKKFDGAWPKFSHVPSNVRQIWWDDFKSHWSISKDDEGLVRSLFEKRCGERLKDMLFTVRTCYATMEKIPAWIPVTVFEKLLEYWESEDFMKVSTANKSNRSRISEEGLPVGKYADGSRSSHDVKACMEKVLGRPVAIAEVFMFTHTNKKDKVPIDDSAAVIEELFKERMPNVFEYFGKKDPIPDELLREADEVFLECAGGVKNGRIKGLGNLSSEYTSGSVSHTMPNEVLTQQVSQLSEENSRLREDLSAVRESLAEEREREQRLHNLQCRRR